MNKRIKKKRRKASMTKLQWAVHTINDFMDRMNQNIKENPEKFRELIEQAEDMDPTLKRRLIEYTYNIEMNIQNVDK